MIVVTRVAYLAMQEDFEDAMNGIVCDTDPGVKDEAPQAYKNLDDVMSDQRDLVEIVHKLSVMVNVKGYETKGPRGKGYKKRGGGNSG